MSTNVGYGTLTGTALQLDAAESRKWGAYAGDGVDVDGGPEYRRLVCDWARAELKRLGLPRIEIYAAGAPIDAHDWQVGEVGEPA